MQQVTISGTLYRDAEKCIDRNGRKYIRFVVTCGSDEPGGRTEFTHYQCTCYMTGFENMKKGDQVFVTGKFSARTRVDDKGKTYMNLNVMVHQINGGYRVSDRASQGIVRNNTKQ